MEGWWGWALVSSDGVAPSRMVSLSASVNLPLHHKVQKFSSGTGLPGWSRKKGRTKVVVWCGVIIRQLIRATFFKVWDLESFQTGKTAFKVTQGHQYWCHVKGHIYIFFFSY